QLLCKHSEEGDTDCLGVFDVPVVKLQPQRHEQKVPHMGWNEISGCQDPILREAEGEFVYFVHSYYVPLCQWTTATTDYVQPFSAALRRDNFHATQFHPEKSGSVGEKILKNFLSIA
ncbi:MAG: imidazole glycerol phosphate synthase subunit HisH, partial [Prevotellaceae bacterium]|nr:imidazole glycerol phosphate synthase subunit HisH [Prevotellaceae bacterium]